MSKNLLIKSTAGAAVKQTNSNGWNQFDNIQNYVDGIDIGKIQNTSDALFTGMPTPWVRAKFFNDALSTVNFISGNTLHDYYQQLVSQWKGLVSLLALYSERVQIEKPISLSKKNNDIQADIFGKMLFEDEIYWKDPKSDDDKSPFIQLIYITIKGGKDKKLIGAFSPYTLVFTALDTDLSKDDADGLETIYKDKMFHAPSNLSPSQVNRLYKFIDNISNNLDAYYSRWNDGNDGVWTNKPLNKVFADWKQELIDVYNADKDKQVFIHNYEPEINGNDGSFFNPISILLKSNIKVYVTDGGFTTNPENGSSEAIDLSTLWSATNKIVEFVSSGADGFLYALSVVDEDGVNRYFPLPVSKRAIELFKPYMGAQVQRFNRTASLKSKNSLSVTLSLKINNEDETIETKVFQIVTERESIDSNRHLVLWPNFITESDNRDSWKDYYVYSEFVGPSSIVVNPMSWDNAIKEFTKLNKETRNQVDDCRPIVKYTTGEHHPYDIYQSTKPVYGFEIEYNGDVHTEVGFVLLNWNNNNSILRTDDLKGATLGFDFGSNNTCVYYKSASDENPKPVELGNFRVDLMGRSASRYEGEPASFDELYFFPSVSSKNGQVKSWVHEQVNDYLDNQTSSFKEEPVQGGASVNNQFFIIKDSNADYIETVAGRLNHNMKWLSSSKEGKTVRSSYIKDVVLQTKASLLRKGLKISRLNWSYPSAMGQADCNKLGKAFSQSTNKLHKITEAEANYIYAKDNLQIEKGQLCVCFDVGGSTTDIMIYNQKGELLRENSIRLAASGVMKSTLHSPSFVNALRQYFNGRRKGNSFEFDDFSKHSMFYINTIFDSIDVDNQDFYNHIDNVAPMAKSVPAYISGLLMLYAGILVANTIEISKLDDINKILYIPFGKGGRVFMWGGDNELYENYYKKCFKLGLEKSGLDPKAFKISSYKDDDNAVSKVRQNNKSEVAIGLCKYRGNSAEDENDDDDSTPFDKICKGDVCGEFGVTFEGKEVGVKDLMEPKHFMNNLDKIDLSRSDVFATFVNEYFTFVKNNINENVQKDNLLTNAEKAYTSFFSYVNGDREYQKANSEDEFEFDYHQPVLIVEGLRFFEGPLMDWLKKYSD